MKLFELFNRDRPTGVAEATNDLYTYSLGDRDIGFQKEFEGTMERMIAQAKQVAAKYTDLSSPETIEVDNENNWLIAGNPEDMYGDEELGGNMLDDGRYIIGEFSRASELEEAEEDGDDIKTKDPRLAQMLKKARVKYAGSSDDDFGAFLAMVGDEQDTQDNEIASLDQHNGTQDVNLDQEEHVNIDQEAEIADLRMRIDQLEQGDGQTSGFTEEIVPTDDDEFPYMDDETGEVFPAGMASTVNYDSDYDIEDDDEDYDFTQAEWNMSEADKAKVFSMFGDVAAGGGDPIDYVMNAMGLDIDNLDELAGDQGYADANEWAESYQTMESVISNFKKLDNR